MQNPFRHEDQQRRPDQNDRMSRDGERPDEYRTWGGGDGGRTAEAFRHQGHDQPREQSRAPGWGSGQNQPGPYGQDMSSPSAGGGYQSGPQAYGSGPQFGQSYGARDEGSQGYGAPAYGGMGAQSFDPRGQTQGGSYGSQMTQGYAQGYGAQGSGQMYGGQGSMGQGSTGQGQPGHGYAPGSQIWEGSGRGMGGQSHQHHDFEPDYLHWREQQLSAFDKDYSDWRNERREKFSSDFDSWRQSRPRSEASGEHHTPAENPIVGDVSDGGTGSSADLKKR